MAKWAIRFQAAAGAGVFCLCAASACAQFGGAVNPMRDSTQKDTVTQEVDVQRAAEDRVFVKNALEAAMRDIQMARLALTKSSNPEVREFAEKIVRDNPQGAADMEPSARRLGIAVPAEMTKSDRKLNDKLSALSGDAFDQAYIKQAVKRHRDDLEAFQNEAASGADPQLKAAAAADIPAIKQHVQLAELMARDQGVHVSGK